MTLSGTPFPLQAPCKRTVNSGIHLNTCGIHTTYKGRRNVNKTAYAIELTIDEFVWFVCW